MVWTRLKYFNKNENWGNPDEMNGLLLITLDEIRDRCNNPIVVHCAYKQTGHSEKSKHYTGDAVDFHVCNMSLRDTYNIIIEVLENFQIVDKTGLGIYLDWNSQGFHLDLRPQRGRWGRIEGEYVGIDLVLSQI